MENPKRTDVLVKALDQKVSVSLRDGLRGALLFGVVTLFKRLFQGEKWRNSKAARKSDAALKIVTSSAVHVEVIDQDAVEYTLAAYNAETVSLMLLNAKEVFIDAPMARKITIVAANTATVKINAPVAKVVRLDIPKARILKLDSVLASNVIVNTHSKCKPTLHLNNECNLAVNGLVIRDLALHEVSLEVAVAFTAALVAGCLNFALPAASVLGGVNN